MSAEVRMGFFVALGVVAALLVVGFISKAL